MLELAVYFTRRANVEALVPDWAKCATYHGAVCGCVSVVVSWCVHGLVT